MALDLCPERFWLITPRLLLTEMKAAVLRRNQQNDVILTAGWLAAKLQRVKKVPDLDQVLGKSERRPRDLGFYLDELKVVLPTTTINEWAARVRAGRQDWDARKRASAHAI
ncbi:hypothetical protein [Paracoccus tibetensis]|nr:hypothetical protein [Paracoccus tibetensis]